MEIFYIALLTFFASTIGTVTWFGTSMIMIIVLVMFIPPIEAIFLVAIIHWFGNLWKISIFNEGFNIKLVLLFGLVGLLTSYFWASFSTSLDKEFFLRLLGLFLVSYSLYLIYKSHFKIKASSQMAFIWWALSGFFAGAFGVGGAIRSMFLSAFNLPKEVYIATIGAIWIIVDSTRLITYYVNDISLPKDLRRGLVIFTLVSFFWAQFAKVIVDKIPQDKFRIVLAIFFLLTGIKLIIWPL